MPTVVPAPFLEFRQYDENGHPLAGGKLYSYRAGTSVPQITYNDPAGTIANSNPVVLSDEGSAEVYLQAGLYYKLRQVDQFDVLQWEEDQISGSGGTGGGTVQTAPIVLQAIAGTAPLVAPAAWAPGWRQLGVTARVTQGFGTAQGLTQLAIGDAVQFDRWGYCGVALLSTTDAADFLTGDSPWTAQPLDALVTPVGGAFDATGAVELTCYYTTLSGVQESIEVPPIPATETQVGVTRYGSDAETVSGTLRTVATHPAGVQAALAATVPPGTALSVARYPSTGPGIESTPGLLTTSDGRLGVNSTPDATDMVRVVALGATGANLTLSRAADTTGAMVLQLHKSRGTEAAPTLVQASDQLGSVHWQGRTRDSGNTQDVDLSLAILRAYVEAVDASQRASGQVRVFTSEASGVVTEKLRLTAAGNLLLGTTTHGTSLRAGLVLGAGTMATAAHPVDAVQIVAEDFEGVAGTMGLRLRSEDGVTTRIGTGVLSRKVVLILSTQTLAAPYLLTEEESGKVLVCTNAAMVQVTLPLAVVGLVYTVLLYVAAGVRIRANTADTIRLGGTTGTAAGSLESTTLHGTITLVAVNASAWMATSVVGTWTHGV